MKNFILIKQFENIISLKIGILYNHTNTHSMIFFQVITSNICFNKTITAPATMNTVYARVPKTYINQLQ